MLRESVSYYRITETTHLYRHKNQMDLLFYRQLLMKHHNRLSKITKNVTRKLYTPC